MSQRKFRKLRTWDAYPCSQKGVRLEDEQECWGEACWKNKDELASFMNRLLLRQEKKANYVVEKKRKKEKTGLLYFWEIGGLFACGEKEGSAKGAGLMEVKRKPHNFSGGDNTGVPRITL